MLRLPTTKASGNYQLMMIGREGNSSVIDTSVLLEKPTFRVEPVLSPMSHQFSWLIYMESRLFSTKPPKLTISQLFSWSSPKVNFCAFLMRKLPTYRALSAWWLIWPFHKITHKWQKTSEPDPRALSPGDIGTRYQKSKIAYQSFFIFFIFVLTQQIW